MNVTCSTCLDLLYPSQDLSSAPCGHVFHTPCVLQWFESSGKSNCPQCRAKCKDSQLRRIFLTQGADLSMSQSDAVALQEKIDNLTFEKRVVESEKEKLSDGLAKQIQNNRSLEERCQKLEKDKERAKKKCLEVEVMIRHIESEKCLLDQAKQEAKEAKEKLKGLETLDRILKANASEVNRILHESGNYSPESRQLQSYIVCLKKKIEEQRLQRQKQEREMRDLLIKCNEQKSVIDCKIKELDEAKLIIQDLKYDLNTAEKQVETLRQALNQPHSQCQAEDVRTSPSKEVTVDDPKPSPLLPRTSSNGVVGLKKRPASPLKDLNKMKIMKTKSLTSDLYRRPLSSSPQYPAFSFNGMGGRAKEDKFPSPVKSRIKNKSNKTNVNKTQKHDQTIDKYFSFDTP